MSRMPRVEEEDATGETAQIYDEIKAGMGIDFVPNIDKHVAISPNVLKGTWGAVRNIFLTTSLPQTLCTMIIYSVSAANKCWYCDSFFKSACLAVGVDQDLLDGLDKDLDSLPSVRL